MLTAQRPTDGARAPPLAPCSAGASRLPLPRSAQIFQPHAQRDSPLTMIRVYVFHYTLLVAIGHSSNARPGLQAQPPFCAATKYPPTGSTLSELASVSGVGGCALKPLGTKRLPGAEGPSETKRKRKAEVLFSSSRFLNAGPRLYWANIAVHVM